MGLKENLCKLFGLRETPNGGELRLRNLCKDLDRESLVDMLVAIDQADGQRDYFIKYLAAEHESSRLRNLFKSEYHTDKAVRHALHVADLEAKCKRLAKEVRSMQVAAERHNLINFATGYVVRCTGCDRGGPANYEDLTEEKVLAVERVANRLRTWFNNHQYRKGRDQA